MNGREAFRNLMERLSNNVTLKEWELCNSDMQIVENALDKLSQIENGDGGESSLMLEYLNKMFEVDRSYDDNAGLADAYGGKTEQMIFMENYILKSQQRERELEELEIVYDKDTLELTDELNILRSKLKRYFELKKDNPYLTQKENKEYIKLSRDLKKEGDFWKVGESDE